MGVEAWGVCNPWQNQEMITRLWNEEMFRKLRPSWWYDYKWDKEGKGIQYVPMAWDMEALSKYIKAQKPWDDSGFLLMMNEPEREDQGNMAPDKGLEMLDEIAGSFITPFTVGPNIQVNDQGLNWLKELRELNERHNEIYGEYASGSEVLFDAWGIHIHCWDFVDFMTQWRKWEKFMKEEMGDPVTTWITEYSCFNPDFDVRKETLAAVADVQRAERFMGRIAYFSTHYSKWQGEYVVTDLMDGNGYITQMGREWLRQMSQDKIFADDEMFVQYLPNIFCTKYHNWGENNELR